MRIQSLKWKLPNFASCHCIKLTGGSGVRSPTPTVTVFVRQSGALCRWPWPQEKLHSCLRGRLVFLLQLMNKCLNLIEEVFEFCEFAISPSYLPRSSVHRRGLRKECKSMCLFNYMRYPCGHQTATVSTALSPSFHQSVKCPFFR